MRKIIALIVSLLALTSNKAFSQTEVTAQPAATTYPKIEGNFSIVLPIFTVNQNTTTDNFSDFYNGFNLGFPVGLNILYGDKFGFSYEFTPSIRTENGNTKMNDVLFDPGPMFRFKNGFTFIPRLAFQTNGRYGITPAFNQIVIQAKNCSYFIAASLPMRFGNNELPSLGFSFQFGIYLY